MNTDSTIVNADSKKFSFFVHIHVESTFTIIWNCRSPSRGIAVHDRVEYAIINHFSGIIVYIRFKFFQALL
jgi:hypothetical protein